MNDNSFKRTEAMLYNYKKTIAEIKILKRDLEIIENNYKGPSAISFDEKSSPTNEFNSNVENEVIKRAEKIEKLSKVIRLKEIEIENIDDALEILNDEERYIVNERYFNNKRNKDIAAKLNVTEQTSCDYKNKIINKLIPFLINHSQSIQDWLRYI